MNNRFVCLLVCVTCVCSLPERTDAATRTVCAAGCAYTDLQPAIDDAAPGDLVLLRAGETFVGHYVLRAKSGGSDSYITIRSDAPDSSLPAAGVRLIPEGRSGANVSLNALARLVGRGGSWQSTPVIMTEPGAHHYRLQFLDVDGAANEGYETLISLGENSSSQTADNVPYAIVLDRLYVHGHPTKGMKRGVSLDSAATDVINSYFSEFMSDSDSQAIAGFNGPGPFRIINNFLQAAGENVMFGGSDPRTPYVVPSDIEIRGNLLSKPDEWRNTVLAAPAGLTGSAGGGGVLAEGVHYFRVAAVLESGGSEFESAPSPEFAVSVPSGGSVMLWWSPVAGAERYRLYNSTSSGGESKYLETTSADTSLLYTGSGQTAGSPLMSGMKWTTKNLLEIKNAQRVTIDGNLFEDVWASFQDGYAIVLTPRNQDNTAPWSVVRDVSFTNNVVRHVGAGLTILGASDTQNPTQPTTNIRIANNLFYDLGPGQDGDGRFLTMLAAPSNVVVDHNTVLQRGNLVSFDGSPAYGFVFTNNLTLHRSYGVTGSGTSPGLGSLTYYVPGYLFAANVLAGGDPAVFPYPAGTYFPSEAELYASFVNADGGNYALLSSSPFKNAATDGKDIGVDWGALVAASSSGASIGADPGSGSGSTSGSSDQGGGSIDQQPPPSGGVPTTTTEGGWQSQDIGDTPIAGAVSQSSDSFAVTGGGADIWGYADAFRFVYRTLSGDGAIVARVSSINGTDGWTKAGVMVRSSLDANAAQASMFVALKGKLAFQRRTVAGGDSTSTAILGGAPAWVRLVRSGNTMTASVSIDGSQWTTLGSDTITLPSTVLVGLAVTSHDASTTATATFDSVSVSGTDVGQQSQSLPSGWTSQDLGDVGLAGSASIAGDTLQVQGAGADVWGTADAFHFVSRTLPGDGDIIARVASVNGTSEWTKAGVMMRMTFDVGSPHAFMLVSLKNKLAFQRRTFAGGDSTSTAIAGAAPAWVRLTRQGTLVIASASLDGVNWTEVGRETLSIDGPMEVGLAVTNHDASSLATALFDNIQVIER